MKDSISIITTITNPVERQDKWEEMLSNYLALADEVIVVNGGHNVNSTNNEINVAIKSNKLKFIKLPWSNEWNWIQLPKAINKGIEGAKMDWIIRLDIDQLIHEKDFSRLRHKLSGLPKDCQVATLQKMSFTYNKKYYQKGGQPVIFRNHQGIRVGENLKYKTDLCFPIIPTNKRRVIDYELPVGYSPKTCKLPISYWNYGYFFKTKEFTKKEFWRFSRAYHRYFHKWVFGDSEESSFKVFLNMMRSRHQKAPYTYKLKDHSKYIKEAVKDLTKEQFGFNGYAQSG